LETPPPERIRKLYCGITFRPIVPERRKAA